MLLNEELNWCDVTASVKNAFLGTPRKLPLLAGRELYKFTQHPLYSEVGVTPWWSAVVPVLPGDTGLDQLLKRAEHSGNTGSELSRARNAVSHAWKNTMSGLLRAKLTSTVFGFAGRVAHQPYDDDPAKKNVFFIGGAIQLWIPNLSAATIRPVFSVVK